VQSTQEWTPHVPRPVRCQAHEERCATPQRESDERSVDLRPSQEAAEAYGSMHGTLAGSSTVVQEAAQRRTSHNHAALRYARGGDNMRYMHNAVARCLPTRSHEEIVRSHVCPITQGTEYGCPDSHGSRHDKMVHDSVHRRSTGQQCSPRVHTVRRLAPTTTPKGFARAGRRRGT
jgi:hypothetical protein